MANATRRCLSCKCDISARGNKSVRCKPCQAAYRDQRHHDDPTRGKCADDDGTCSKSRLKRGRCSRHYYTARRDGGGNIPQQPRACVTCGIVFTPVRSDAEACSTLCNWRKQDIKDRVDYPERPCATCGTAFKPARAKTMYCSVECIADPARRATARWVQNNPGTASLTRYRRQARLRENPDSVPLSNRDWLRLVRRYDHRCAYCGDRPEELTIDHVVPVARGGRHGIGNTLPACRSCNSAKRDVLLVEFKLRLQRDRQRKEAVAAQRQRLGIERLLRLSGGSGSGPIRFQQLDLGIFRTDVVGRAGDHIRACIVAGPV